VLGIGSARFNGGRLGRVATIAAQNRLDLPRATSLSWAQPSRCRPPANSRSVMEAVIHQPFGQVIKPPSKHCAYERTRIENASNGPPGRRRRGKQQTGSGLLSRLGDQVGGQQATATGPDARPAPPSIRQRTSSLIGRCRPLPQGRGGHRPRSPGSQALKRTTLVWGCREERAPDGGATFRRARPGTTARPWECPEGLVQVEGGRQSAPKRTRLGEPHLGIEIGAAIEIGPGRHTGATTAQSLGRCRFQKQPWWRG